ncbi:MAG: GAF domain-containing protein [Leptolyngbyaceae cyanobacterium CRU_2_3]|nr:GAF domain-containing protein [Leptolyngbyaceae cyanobacterium CRU_2_3]
MQSLNNTESDLTLPLIPDRSSDPSLKRILDRLSYSIQRDDLVQQTTNYLREALQVDRVVLYYFYSHWKGQVTFESLSTPNYSIFGSTGPDECFNEQYAALYLAGRSRAIADIETEPIAECHRDFLREMAVRANLVVPILTPKGLWGLLAAHHCQSPHPWSLSEIDLMRTQAAALAKASAIAEN